MTGDTHKLERNTSQAAFGYKIQRLELRVKELEAALKQAMIDLRETRAEKEEERRTKLRYAAELRKLTTMKPDGDVDD